jgi:hypothetical protein
MIGQGVVTKEFLVSLLVTGNNSLVLVWNISAVERDYST